MTQLLASLIDKQDSFEIVRDQIALILANEVANQQALAVLAAKDPALWGFKIYTDRANPFGAWLNIDENAAPEPIVNILLDNIDYPADQTSGAGIKSRADVDYLIDIAAAAPSANNPAGGHFSGDQVAAATVQRIYRLVRNILMAGINQHLQLRIRPLIDGDPAGVVLDRFARSFAIFQPSSGQQIIQNAVGGRFTLRVTMVETTEQFTGESLETVLVKILRDDDGAVLPDPPIAEAQYDF